MAIGQKTRVSLPSPSQWEVSASFGGRPTSLGTLILYSVTNGIVQGAINFRGSLIPIQGSWNEAARQIAFESPYASFVGSLLVKDEPLINLRHFVLRGNVLMKPPSIRAGETGTWAATTEIRLS